MDATSRNLKSVFNGHGPTKLVRLGIKCHPTGSNMYPWRGGGLSNSCLLHIVIPSSRCQFYSNECEYYLSVRSKGVMGYFRASYQANFTTRSSFHQVFIKRVSIPPKWRASCLLSQGVFYFRFQRY